jgi:hypothetical protein
VTAILQAVLTCPRCGGHVHFDDIAHTGPRNAHARITCQTCRRTQILILRIVEGLDSYRPNAREPRANEAQCGTSAGYQAHRRRQEPACEPCLRANAAAKADYVNRNRTATNAAKRAARQRRRATAS